MPRARRSARRLRRSSPGAHGFGAVPADEALAQVVVEVSGRPQLHSNADLTGVGGLGSDLAARFLMASPSRPG